MGGLIGLPIEMASLRVLGTGWMVVGGAGLAKSTRSLIMEGLLL